MTPLFLYLIKVNIALVFFYTAYRYGLRRLTFYTLNRFFLLLAIGFSSVYPLIDVNALLPGSKETGGQIIQYLPNLGSLARENPLEIWRSEEHTSELQSLMSISYAVLCLKKKR